MRRPLAPPDALIFRPLRSFIVATAPVSCANATTSALVRLNIQLWPVHLCARLLSTAEPPQSWANAGWLSTAQCMLLGFYLLPSGVYRAQIYAPELSSGCKGTSKTSKAAKADTRGG